MNLSIRQGDQVKDKLTERILAAVQESGEPMETKELLEKLSSSKKGKVTRAKLFYRLNLLRGDGKIKGKFVGPGKGVWIWWDAKGLGVKKQ